MTTVELVDLHREMRDQLIESNHFLPTGVDGLYGRGAEFEGIVSAIDTLVCDAGSFDEPTSVFYPPLIPKLVFDKIDYLRNFPHLAGPVFTFQGDNAAHKQLVEKLDSGEPYQSELSQSEVVLTPACCYAIYPSLAGALPADGAIYQHQSYCFRHEPSVDPMRLQVFRQREHIRVGSSEQVLDWRSGWLERAPKLMSSLGLDVSADVANDPFFGRAGRLMSMSQREQQLKIEFLVPVFGEANATACASINYHQSHFGELFEIEAAGEPAHSCCIGFGLERCAVAMLAAHGMSVGLWPQAIRDLLWP